MFFKQLTTPEFLETIPWAQVHLFWGDERCVPPSHPDSNYKMAKELLLDLTSLPATNIHRIRGENDPKEEAIRYTIEIQNHLSQGGNGVPQFDWVLLGLGSDGHTASLFPGSPSKKASDLCLVTSHPETGQKRITMSLPLLNNALSVNFLVSGREKANIVRQILEGSEQTESYPAGQIKPLVAKPQWWMDEDAAAGLSK